jgi:hypothetical protein
MVEYALMCLEEFAGFSEIDDVDMLFGGGNNKQLVLHIE